MKYASYFTEYFIDARRASWLLRGMQVAHAPIVAAFARVLRARRVNAGISQEELAHRAGLSMRYISLLESRKHVPSLATMQALAEGLGVALSSMITECENDL